MRFGSLFSGIGGLDLGLERAGMECAWQVENDPYAARVLAKHWPVVPRYGDIRELSGDELAPTDLICGGFPCQPVSHAGKRRGQDDPRWLWPEFFRIVRAIRPRYVFVENVPGLLDRGLGDVLGDLAGGGYDAEWDVLPAAALGAPHLRYRVLLVAYPSSERRYRRRDTEGSGNHLPAQRETAKDQSAGDQWIGGAESGGAAAVADPDRRRCGTRRGGARIGRLSILDRRREGFAWPGADPWAFEPDVGRVAYGVPARVDRLRGLGNAVVPQVAEWIGRQIMKADSERRVQPCEAAVLETKDGIPLRSEREG